MENGAVGLSPRPLVKLENPTPPTESLLAQCRENYIMAFPQGPPGPQALGWVMDCGTGNRLCLAVLDPLLEPLTDLAQVSEQWPTCPIPTSMGGPSPWVTVYRTQLPIRVDWGGSGPAACWVPGSLIEGGWAGYRGLGKRRAQRTENCLFQLGLGTAGSNKTGC